MSDKPWEDYATSKPWEDFKTPEPKTIVSGKFLPISKNDRGEVFFDSNAGVVGAVKRAFNLPGEVMRGQVDLKSEEGLGRALEMATVVTPVGPAARAVGVPGVLPMRPGKVPAPSAEALYQAADAGYDAARQLGVTYDAGAVHNLAAGVRQTLEADGIIAELAPKTFAVIDKLSNPPAGAVAPFTGVEAARKGFGRAARDFSNPTEQVAAMQAVEGIDRFLAQPPGGAVLAGDAKAAAALTEEARKNWGAAARSDRVTGIEREADLRSVAANSGQNYDNTTRQRIVGLLLNQKKSAGYSQQELDALEGVARGDIVRNGLRRTGNMLGGGGGLGAAVASGLGGAAGAFLGGTHGGITGAAAGAALAPIVGAGARAIENQMTDRAMRVVDALIRQRSPMYEQAAAAAPATSGSPEGVASIIRALLSGQQGR